MENAPKTIDCGGLEPLDLLGGELLTTPDELHIKLSPRSSEKRSHIIGGVVTLFHKNLIAELNNLEIDNIQYFPVHMHAPDGMVEKAYSIPNIIGLVDAVDLEKSTLDEKVSGIRQTLYSFTIDEAKTKGLHVFRILHAPSLIIIDEWLFEKLVTFKVKGVMMYPTEDYNGWS